jgi:hypothetical protein
VIRHRLDKRWQLMSRRGPSLGGTVSNDFARESGREVDGVRWGKAGQSVEQGRAARARELGQRGRPGGWHEPHEHLGRRHACQRRRVHLPPLWLGLEEQERG